MKNIKGFTLIELLVVVFIIAVLSAVALPLYQNAVLKTRAAGTFPMLRALSDAQARYFLASDGEYARTFENLDVAATNGCKDLQCQVGGNVISLVPDYGNVGMSFGANVPISGNFLTIVSVYEPSAYKEMTGQTVKQNQLVCYDRGKSAWTRVCQSFLTETSFSWSGGKAWVIK